MAKFCKDQIPTTRPLDKNKFDSGFTLIELLVALSLLMVIIIIAFMAFNSTNKLVETDTGRITATQNTQTALDLLSDDVRQAGENLELNLKISGVEFDNSAKTLTVRRSIPPLPSTGVKLAQLPICFALGTSVQVVGPPPSATTAASATARCAYSDGDGDGESDNIAPWRTYFDSQEGRPQAALLYRPKSATQTELVQRTTVRRIEAQQIVTPLGGTPIRRVSVTLGSAIPVTDFNATNNSLLILVDERRYSLINNELRLALGGQTDAESQPVAFNVTNFSINANLVNPTENVTSIGLTGPWARVKNISMSLTAGNIGQGKTTSRTYDALVFPRNVETARGTAVTP